MEKIKDNLGKDGKRLSTLKVKLVISSHFSIVVKFLFAPAFIECIERLPIYL